MRPHHIAASARSPDEMGLIARDLGKAYKGRQVVNGVVQYLDPMMFLATTASGGGRAVLISDVSTGGKAGLAGAKNPSNSQC